jgi:outer membrane lipoprotein-sorting protein
MGTKTMCGATVVVMLTAGVLFGLEGAAAKKPMTAAEWLATAEPNRAVILARVKAAYKDMRSFTATGQVVTKTVVEDPNTCKRWQEVTKTDLAMKLARPGMYLVEWNQRKGIYPESLLSAVYSDGKGNFLVTGGTKTPQPDRAAALAAAAALPEGVSSTTLSLFFDGVPGSIEGPGMMRKLDETIEGVDCYELSRKMMPRGSETRVWIAKYTYLVKRCETTVTVAPGIDPEPTDAQVRRIAGPAATDDYIWSMKEGLPRSEAMDLAGTVRTMQTYDDMKVDPIIKESEFMPAKALEGIGRNAAGGTEQKSVE